MAIADKVLIDDFTTCQGYFHPRTTDDRNIYIQKGLSGFTFAVKGDYQHSIVPYIIIF